MGGAAPAQDIHVVLNGMDWYDNDTGSAPADRLSPPNPSICDSKTLDVKATEDDTDALFGWLPFFPDIKRKARVQIEEAAGLSGLLPIAVRIPRPLSAAVVFYDETPGADYGKILDVKYLCEDELHLRPPCRAGRLDELELDGSSMLVHVLGAIPSEDLDRRRDRDELPVQLRSGHAAGGATLPQRRSVCTAQTR